MKISNNRIMLSQSLFGTVQGTFQGDKKIETTSNHPTAGQTALI